MAREFDIQPINALPESTDQEINSGQIIIVTGGRAKRAPSLRMKGAKGDTGDSAYLRNTSTYIQWKLGVNGSWQNLISIADITGPKGEKPLFRTSAIGIEYKYENEPETAYRLLISVDVLKLKFTDLTTEQKDELTLHFNDLTEEQIKELQQPAIDAAESISILEESLKENEQERAEGEALRRENEETRNSNETARQSAEAIRGTNETARISTEERRVTAEETRVEAEEKRVIAETSRATAETLREENETLRHENTATAIENADQATNRLNTLSDHRDEIRDSCWWRWDEATETYVNTGEKARGDVMYATFEVNTSSGELTMITPDGYNGPVFDLDTEGNINVLINE